MADPHLTKMNSHITSTHLTNTVARIAARFARHSLHASRAVACFALHSCSAAWAAAHVAPCSHSAARAAARIDPLVVACGSLLSLPTVLNIFYAPRASALRINCWRVMLLRHHVVACRPLSLLPTAAFDRLNIFLLP